MGAYLDQDGKLCFKTSENTTTQMGSTIKDLAKTAAVGTAIVGGTAAIAGPAAGAVGAGALAIAVASELLNEKSENIEITELEDAHGGTPMEEIIRNYDSTQPKEINNIEAEITDPFEAFRQSMKNAGIEPPEEVNKNENIAPGCIDSPRPQKELSPLLQR